MGEPHLMRSAQGYTLVFASSVVQTLEMILMSKVTDIPETAVALE